MGLDEFIFKAGAYGGLVAGGVIGWAWGDYLVSEVMSTAPPLVEWTAQGALTLLGAYGGLMVGGRVGASLGEYIADRIQS